MKKSFYLDDSRHSIDWGPQSIDWDHSHRRRLTLRSVAFYAHARAHNSRAARRRRRGRTEGFIGRQPLGAGGRRRCGRRFKEKHTGAALRHTC